MRVPEAPLCVRGGGLAHVLADETVRTTAARAPSRPGGADAGDTPAEPTARTPSRSRSTSPPPPWSSSSSSDVGDEAGDAVVVVVEAAAAGAVVAPPPVRD